jgi:flagellar FliL protein
VAKDKSKGKDKGKDKAPDAKDAANPEVEGEEGEGGGKKKLPMMMIIIAAVVAVVVIGGGVGGFMIFMPHAPTPADAHKLPPKPPKKDDKDGKPDPNAPQVQDGPDGVVFYTEPDIVVNMQTPDGKQSFLKLKLTFELPDHDTADTINAEAPRLNDVFQTFLRELRPEDLSGSEGTLMLRAELARRINLVIAPNKVNGVLIEEMLIN